jgi:hypothetical protein
MAETTACNRGAQAMVSASATRVHANVFYLRDVHTSSARGDAAGAGVSRDHVGDRWAATPPKK